MKKPNVTKLLKNAGMILSKKSPEILTGIGIGLAFTTTVLAVKATPKALKLIEDAQREKGEPLTTIETVKVASQPYIPAAVTGVASVACLVGANSVSTRRNVALAAAYQLSETARNEYRDKVVETIGEKKEQAVRDAIAKDKVEANPVSKSEVILVGDGKTLFYDPMSGRYFQSDIAKVERAANELNRRITLGEMYASLNDFYDEIELARTEAGDILGWNTDRLIELDFSAQRADDGRPCLAIGFLYGPTYGFSSLY